MADQIAKPLPVISDFNRGFWDAARNGELSLQRCNSCGQLWAPSGCVCPHCLSDDFSWKRLSGRAKVTSWVVFHKLYLPSFAQDIPYNCAFVELEEGPRLISNIVGVANADIYIGMPLEVVFEDVSEEIRIPKFRPISPA